MAIFRGTGGSGSSSDSTIVDAVTAQATIATTKAGEASTSATTATTKASEASASATTATTKATEANASATTAEGNKDLCVSLRGETLGLAQDALASANAAEASATTANSSAVQTVAGSNTQVVGVYNNIANVNTVAGVNTDVTTVAGISSDVTTVAADASDIGTVSTNIANVNNVGNNIANVNAVHGNASNINTVAADGTDIGTVSSNIANVNTVAGISSTVTTVAGLESKMDTVIADASDIGAVAGNIGDVTTVAGINSDVDTVAGIAAKVTTVADNISDVQNADTNATNAASSASNASASATSASNSATTSTTKATEASNSATAASNSATTATTKASQAAGSATTAGTSASTATTKASEASASATTATTKAGEAASSASAASGSATTATTKAAEADASAVSAASSATKSSNAASTWNNFYNSYLGVADAPPSVDVLGNAIVAGALYYDTGAGSNTVGLYVYNGSSWVYSTNYNNVTAPYILAQDLNANGKKIISAGRVGIGTSSPSRDLSLNSSGTTTLQITNDTVGTATTDGFQIKHYTSGATQLWGYENNYMAFATNNTERTRITASGDVGIGTTSPATKLAVSGGYISQTDGTRTLYLGSDGTGGLFGTTTNHYLRFITNNNERMLIDSSGNVGIGTSNPNRQLSVNNFSGNGTLSINAASSGASTMYFADGATGTSIYSGFIQYNHSNNAMQFATNGGNERMRIDSSGRVGIGTVSPNVLADLHVADTTDARIWLDATSGDTMELYSGDGVGVFNRSNSHLLFGTNNDEKMRITSTGNVGIGTNNPSHKLDISGGHLRLDDAYRIRFGGGTAAIEGNSSSNILSLITNNTERMRIDASGNLLVGKTGASVSTAGAELRADGQISSTRSGDTPVFINRLTNDGKLIDFRKDGSTVGSISAVSGDMYLGTANVNLRFTDSANDIRPVNSSGVNLDNTVDLGASATRFKDLYLSGGVHLGGTTAANKLDDYEEGTFTLNTAGDSSGAFQDTPTCLYTKIGNTVNVFITFRVGANFASQSVGGLPFTASHAGMNSSYISGGIAITGSNNTISATVHDSTTTIRFHDNQNTSDAHLPNTTDEYYRLNFTYKTTA